MAYNSEVSELQEQLEVVYTELAEIRAQWKVKAEELATIRAAHNAKLEELRVLTAQLKRLTNVGVRGGHVRDEGGVGGGPGERNEVGGVDDEMECIINYKNHHRYALVLFLTCVCVFVFVFVE